MKMEELLYLVVGQAPHNADECWTLRDAAPAFKSERASRRWEAAKELALRLVDDGNSKPQIQGPRDVLAQVDDIRRKPKEHFVCLYLNCRNQILHKELVSLGTVNASLVHPRELFEPAIRFHAVAVILVHNHPSHDPQPSDEDVALTRRLAQAGTLLGIEVLDHLIVCAEGYSSMKDARLL